MIDLFPLSLSYAVGDDKHSHGSVLSSSTRTNFSPLPVGSNRSHGAWNRPGVIRIDTVPRRRYHAVQRQGRDHSLRGNH